MSQEYKWNGEDLIFNMGAQLSRQGGAAGDEGLLGDKLEAAGIFWLCVLLLGGVFNALITVTGTGLGMAAAVSNRAIRYVHPAHEFAPQKTHSRR